MARAAVPGRLTWRKAVLREARQETPTARTLVLDVEDWPGHLPGQHVDLRLTAEDGYTAQRSYSIASATGLEITVQRLDDGEVSPYLTDVWEVGQPIELRGPIGGWFVWRPTDPAPVQLMAGGSGVVPLMAMIRSRAEHGVKTPFRLLYSVRTPQDVIYADELRRRARDDRGLDVQFVYTRVRGSRVGVADVNTHAWPADFQPNVFVCGPTGFVETVADIMVALGHDARGVKTERYG
ncbi:ferredoxin reductase [Dactylosporangium sucinum]|uniref:Oxidoreductase n=1 Tax=Dactylosporangium sucinum TaxID=1424081 RepID=A0A917UA92_9ACTN|nr:ferredoxin reductase [Dactylosporangium sucinum]GGM66117.1 oxidoreductase [Dactylosporangium sucinum]